jgi:hypothetical protein
MRTFSDDCLFFSPQSSASLWTFSLFSGWIYGQGHAYDLNRNWNWN